MFQDIDEEFDDVHGDPTFQMNDRNHFDFPLFGAQQQQQQQQPVATNKRGRRPLTEEQKEVNKRRRMGKKDELEKTKAVLAETMQNQANERMVLEQAIWSLNNNNNNTS